MPPGWLPQRRRGAAASPSASGRPSAPSRTARRRRRRRRCSLQATEIELRLHQSPGRRGRQRPDLLQRLDHRGRQGHLRPEDQASARRRQHPPDRCRRQDHLRQHHGSERRLPRRLRRFAARRHRRPDAHGRVARRPHQRQLHGVPEAASTPPASPARTIRKKPPLWQVKAARIIHDEGEKMIYFENARLEFFGMPIAYMPYFSTPDPTVKRKTGFLMPIISVEFELRRRRRGALFLGAGAGLRPDAVAELHDQAGPAAAGRMAPAAGERLYIRSAAPASGSSTRTISCAATAPPTPGYPRLPRQHRNHRPVRAERQMGLGLGRDRGHPTRPSWPGLPEHSLRRAIPICRPARPKACRSST